MPNKLADICYENRRAFVVQALPDPTFLQHTSKYVVPLTMNGRSSDSFCEEHTWTTLYPVNRSASAYNGL
jgi:hypothetical protein